MALIVPGVVLATIGFLLLVLASNPFNEARDAALTQVPEAVGAVAGLALFASSPPDLTGVGGVDVDGSADAGVEQSGSLFG